MPRLYEKDDSAYQRRRKIEQWTDQPKVVWTLVVLAVVPLGVVVIGTVLRALGL